MTTSLILESWLPPGLRRFARQSQVNSRRIGGGSPFRFGAEGFVRVLRHFQDPQPLDVVRQAHQFPFSADLRKAAKQELPESHHLLDDPEHRLNGLLSFGVQTSARIDAWLKAEQSTPSKQLIRQERFGQLAEALEELPEDQRMALRLHYFRGKKVKQVAERMGKTPAAVAGLIRRGLADLRASMAETSLDT